DTAVHRGANSVAVFFFQAEDGIRDFHVTGVQTCALPISTGDGIGDLKGVKQRLGHVASLGVDAIWLAPFFTSPMADMGYDVSDRSEERRVGKECTSREGPVHSTRTKKQQR